MPAKSKGPPSVAPPLTFLGASFSNLPFCEESNCAFS
jgi:hypothetical protein